MAILFADPPDWEDDPGAYEFTATMTAVVLINNEQMGDIGDMLAAFDDAGDVRGIALQLDVPENFPSDDAGTILYEIQIRSNSVDDLISFKYYDASEDAVLDIVETYDFVINDVIGDVVDPMEFNLEFVTLTFNNAHSTGINIHYESNAEIAGFQFNVEGVTLTSASGGDAEEYGLSISFSSTVLGFSLSGATIPSGSGTLISIGFEEISGNTSLNVNNVVISGPGGNSIQSSGPGSIAINSPPELFEYNQSQLQAFYYFNLVLINDIEVESNDWVGAFRNGYCSNAAATTEEICGLMGAEWNPEEICVGARKWDTSLCGSGICELPVLGDDGSDYTNGYMVTGDFPTFKIYDASENSYYPAESSENSEWYNGTFPFAEILSANVSVPGCTDPDYCNYDPSATEDDGSCDPSDESCLGCTDLDACNFNANATIDNGSCYDAEENHDCDGNCTAEVDCAGECGGSAILDLCGVCDNYIATNGFQPDFPYGNCDCLGNYSGSAYNDKCSECDDNASNDCTQDCSGEWGGSSNEDNCGECDEIVSNDCIQDCSGDWGGKELIGE